MSDGVELHPNAVFVVSQRGNVHLEGNRFRLSKPTEKFSYPIDAFFESLAYEWGDRAMGILLSGTGTDGTSGLEAIGQAGGLALVQSADTAEFNAMPSNPIGLGLVDEILSPRQLAEAVCDLVHFAAHAVVPRANGYEALESDCLQQILDILTEEEHVNFSNYKVSTLSRRIAHRIAFTHSASIDDYIHLLQRSPEERRHLRYDMLIGVTSFFRDAPAWSVLSNQVLPKLVESIEPGQSLRVWVAACATGEEAYSMAIAVDEAIARSGKDIRAKIFATDIDAHALEVASAGIYDERIAEQVSPERLKRYFFYEAGTYRVRRSLREMLILAPHDLTQHSGFSRMHLVSCRNVLIYMQPVLQNQVLRLLRFSLIPHEGILFLGNSETLGDYAGDFTPINPRWKLFQKRQDTPPVVTVPAMQPKVAPLTERMRSSNRQRQFGQILEQVFQVCFADASVTCLLVNDAHQIVHVFHNTAEVLEMPVGSAELDVLRIVRSDLRLPLTTALHRVRRDRQQVVYRGITRGDGDGSTLTLRVDIYGSRVDQDTYFIVLFEQDRVQGAQQAIAPLPISTFEMSAEAAQHIAELEYELRHIRESLHVAVEELETSNEEQQATNEELLASNEELQSTNEELQSANEELYTVNAEYQRKIRELTQLTSDIDNLLRSTNIGVIFLDRQIQIRKFTPVASQVVNICLSDLGRPLSHFTHQVNCTNLIAQVQQVLDTATSLEQEVTLLNTGDRLLMGIHPYLKDNDECDGVVMTFVYINDLKQAQDELQRRTDELEHLYETVPAGLGVIDHTMRLIRSNRVLAEINGYDSVEDHTGRRIQDLIPAIAERVIPLYQQVLDTGEPMVNVEITAPHPRMPEVEGTWLGSYYPIELLDGQQAINVTVVDITALKQTERQLQQNSDLREAIFQESTDAIFLVDAETGITFDCNRRAIELFEAECKDDLLNVEGNALQKEPFTPDELTTIRSNLNAHGFWETDLEYVTLKGNEFWGALTVKQITVAGQRVNLVQIADITAHKQAALILSDYNRTLELNIQERTEALRNSNESFRRALSAAKMVCWERDLVTGDIWAFGRHVGDGWVPEEWHLMSDDAPIHPDDVDRVRQAVDRAIATQDSFEVEHRVVFPSHPPVWMLTTGTVLTDDAGSPTRLFGMTFNINDRKRAEIARQASEIRFRSIAENIPGAVLEYSLYPDGSDQVIYMSQGCCDLWEIDVLTVQENTQLFWSLVHPDDLAPTRESIFESAQTLQPWHWEWRIVTPSGKQKWLRGAGNPRRMENGDVVWNTVILDVSDRHQAEDALRCMTAHLERAQQIAHLGSWEQDFITNTLVWSWETLNIFGLPPDAEISYDSFMQSVHPDDVDRLCRAQDDTLQGISPLDIEYRIILPDGEIRTLYEKREATFTPDGQLLSIAGTVLDITEQKASQQALQEREQFLQSIYNYANNSIFVVDVLEDGDFRFAAINPIHEQSTGLLIAEVQGKTPEEVLLPDDAAAVRQNYQRCVDAGDVISYEEFLPFHGQPYWWLTSLSPIRDETGRICRIVGTSANITDRKQTEESLRVSEAQFRTVFENTEVGIAVVFPPDFEHFTLTNATFQRMLGYGPDELAQMNWKDITYEDDQDAEHQLAAQCHAGHRNSYQLEKRYVRKDQSIIWVNVVVTLIRDSQGRRQIGMAIAEDITERKRALDLEIARNRDLKEAIFEESTDALFFVDGNTGLTLDCNQRAVELFEADSKEELINISGTTLQKYPFTAEELAAIEAAVEKAGTWSSELEYVTKKGNSFWGRISAKRLSIAGKPRRLIQVTDISDRKQVELDMRHNMEELQRLNTIKDDFLSTVSHELRTPLTSIDMAGRMLQLALEQQNLISANGDDNSNKFARYLRILRDQTRQEGDLINDLLDLQRLNADAYAVNNTVIDLPIWLQSITDNIHERAAQEQQRFEAMIADDIPLLNTDDVVLRRILSELLNNACKYTPAQERIRLTVCVLSPDTTEREDSPNAQCQFIQFQVLNTGIEISPEDQQRIFEPFYRAVQSDRWSKRGTGLGLTLAQKFVDRLSGVIILESGFNQTCFTVQLPLLPSSDGS